VSVANIVTYLVVRPKDRNSAYQLQPKQYPLIES